MVKKWTYRIMAFCLVIFIIVKTREYFGGEVQDYIIAREKQRAIWNEKAEWNRQVQQDIIRENEEGVKNSSFVFEPSDASGDDFFLDMSSYAMWESGEYLCDTGEKGEHKRRLRYSEILAVDCSEYIVTLTEGYTLYICEYDSEKKFIRSMAYKGGETYAVSKKGAYFSITLRKNTQEKTMSPGQWGSVFSNGIEIVICTKKWLQ